MFFKLSLAYLQGLTLTRAKPRPRAQPKADERDHGEAEPSPHIRRQSRYICPSSIEDHERFSPASELSDSPAYAVAL